MSPFWDLDQQHDEVQKALVQLAVLHRHGEDRGRSEEKVGARCLALEPKRCDDLATWPL